MEHSGNIPIFNIPGTIFREQYSGNNICEYYPQFLWALFLNIPGIYHGNVPRIFHEYIFARREASTLSLTQVEVVQLN